VVAHPAIWGVTAAVPLIALAAPALGMRLGEPALDVPPGQAVVATTNAIEQAFPQTPSSAEVVVTGPGATGPRVLAAVAALQGRAAAAGPIRPPVTATAVGGGALLVDVPLAGHGSDSVSDQALLTLRNQILPATLGRVPGISYAVTGDTASEYDFTHQLHDRTPAVLGLVAALAFVLLLIAFRSVRISLVSILLNLLSVGALIMVAVFSIFATLSLVDLKILGIGTAAAVLIDATVVRGILVPAALTLLGERAWRARRP
jgi:RND superfamily putative drug exporter